MGKNHRHKKHLKQEKAKTKLKTQKTKFLPKGQNITDLSFKIKPIVLLEQLKLKENETLSSRKLNLKEILNRLTHHNTSVKYDNSQQLLQLINSETPEFLKLNLGLILKALCPLILDIEFKVRREAIKVLSKVLQLTTSSDITPFFEILSSFLRCSMTHINLNVQEDSLLTLDALLQHVPDLLAQNSHKILVNFFTLISKLKNDSKHTRTLSENLKSKYTGVKWRIQVLNRLKKILEAIYEENSIGNISDEIEGTVIDMEETNFVPLYSNKFSDMKPQIRSIEVERIESYIDTLLPLLQETWLEVAPSNVAIQTSGKINSTIIKNQVAMTLNCILKTFYLLFRLTNLVDHENNTELIKKYKNGGHFNLLNTMLIPFPFGGVLEKKHESFGVHNDIRCVEENLLICYLFTIQYRNINGKWLKYAERILLYLNYCFELFSRNKEYLRHGKLKDLFISIITTILGKNLTCWRHANLKMDHFIENTIRHYLKNVAYDTKIDFLILLYSIVDPGSEQQYSLAEKSCRQLLAPEISSKVLDFVSLMVKKGVRLLQDCLSNKLSEILGNIDNIKITGVDIERVKIVRILCLFHYVPLTDSNRQDLIQFGTRVPLYSSVISSIVE